MRLCFLFMLSLVVFAHAVPPTNSDDTTIPVDDHPDKLDAAAAIEETHGVDENPEHDPIHIASKFGKEHEGEENRPDPDEHDENIDPISLHHGIEPTAPELALADIDLDKDGKIDHGELVKRLIAMHKLQADYHHTETHEPPSVRLTSKEKETELARIKEIMEIKDPEENEWMGPFKELDKNDDGKLTFNEFYPNPELDYHSDVTDEDKAVARDMNLAMAEVETLRFKNSDENKDDTLNFGEYIYAMHAHMDDVDRLMHEKMNMNSHDPAIIGEEAQVLLDTHDTDGDKYVDLSEIAEGLIENTHPLHLKHSREEL